MKGTTVRGLVVLSAFCLVNISSFGFEGQSKVSSWLLEKYQRSEENPTVLIYMKEEADFSSVSSKSNRNERLRKVFNQLVKTAERSQSSLLNWLDSQKITARSYYVSNLIVAENVSKNQVS